MYTTYHFHSVSEITTDVIDSIKAAYKGKPIVLTVEEEMDATAYLMSSPANKAMLEHSLDQARRREFIEVKPGDL